MGTNKDSRTWINRPTSPIIGLCQADELFTLFEPFLNIEEALRETMRNQ